MSIIRPSYSPSYSPFSKGNRKTEPLRDDLRDESLKNCKRYLSEYLALVIIIDITDDQGLTSQEFKIRDITQYDKLIVSLLHLWFEYNKVYRRFRSDTTADRFNIFGTDLTMPTPDSTENNEKLVLFKTLAIYDDSLPEIKSKADIGIINLITRALKDSKMNGNRTLFKTQDYESTIIAEIICHILRVYFDTYFRHELFKSEKNREDLLIRLYKELLIRLYDIIKLNDKHRCIHIHTGVGMNLDGDRARFCKQIQIICGAMVNLGIECIKSDSVVALCFQEDAKRPAAAEAAVAAAAEAAATRPGVELEMEPLSPLTTAGGKSTRRRKAYKTTRRNNKHKNKKHYRRKRHTKRCKKTNRRRRSRR